MVSEVGIPVIAKSILSSPVQVCDQVIEVAVVSVAADDASNVIGILLPSFF